MNTFFLGRKKLITIPLVFALGFYFLPLTILAVIAYFTKQKVGNQGLRNVCYIILALLAFPFILAYATPTKNSPEIVSQKIENSTISPATSVSTEQPRTEKPKMVDSISNQTLKPKAVLATTIAKATPQATTAPLQPVNPPTVAPRYSCNCSKTCTEISSCDEAQYLLNVCGCGARDNDKDGIACDSAPLHCQN